MTSGKAAQDRFLALVEAIRRQHGDLSPLAGGMIAALFCGISADSRSFAKTFGIAHALVLREIALLDGSETPFVVVSRDLRTQRTHLQLSEKGTSLVAPLARLS